MDHFSKRHRSKAHFNEDLKQYLSQGEMEYALNTIKEALRFFPSDLVFLSYYGYLLSSVEGNPKDGAKICAEAIKTLGKTMPHDAELYYPLFYLNLGRSYLCGDRKQDAVKAFSEGLKFDSKNQDLISELKRLGLRKSPVLSFLDRGNPVNKYLGKLRQRLQK